MSNHLYNTTMNRWADFSSLPLSIGYTDGGVVKELLDQTQAGVHVSNEEELKKYLMQAYREYKETGVVKYHGIESEVMKYSHREMAKKFAEVLDTIVNWHTHARWQN